MDLREGEEKQQQERTPLSSRKKMESQEQAFTESEWTWLCTEKIKQLVTIEKINKSRGREMGGGV